MECPAWDGERQALTAVVGQDLSLPALVEAMLEGEDKWRAALEFCGRVMSQKERAERERRGEMPSPDLPDGGGVGGGRPPPRRRIAIPRRRLRAHLRA
jgi:hypothetical protein